MKQLYRRILEITYLALCMFQRPMSSILQRMEQSLAMWKSAEEANNAENNDTALFNEKTTEPVINSPTRTSNNDKGEFKKANVDDLLQPVNQPPGEAIKEIDKDDESFDTLFERKDDILDESEEESGTDENINSAIQTVNMSSGASSDESEEETETDENINVAIQTVSMSSGASSKEVNIDMTEQDVDEEIQSDDTPSSNNDNVNILSEDSEDNEEADIFGDGGNDDLAALFGTLQTDVISPRAALIASLPIVTGQELREESEDLIAIIRRWQ